MAALRIGIASLLILLHASTALASGSYVRGAPHRSGLDDFAKYDLGRSVTQGRLPLPAPEGDALSRQAEILTAFATQLPNNARARLDLPALAGRLNAEQLDAVRYYLKVRYRVD